MTRERISDEKAGAGLVDNATMRERLRAAFSEAPVTQAAAARRLGITAQAVTGWLRTGKIDKRRLSAVSELLGKPLDYFMDPGTQPVHHAPGGNAAPPPALVHADQVLLDIAHAMTAERRATWEKIGRMLAELERPAG